jgi:hypothetical protein
MPCNPDEPDYHRCEQPNPVTPAKPPRNAGAGHDKSDAENSECQCYPDEPFRKKKRTRVDIQKRERHLIVYVHITLWPTGKRAEMNEDAMMSEVAEEAGKEMELNDCVVRVCFSRIKQGAVSRCHVISLHPADRAVASVAAQRTRWCWDAGTGQQRAGRA